MNHFPEEDLGSDTSDDDYCPEADSVSECESDIEKVENDESDLKSNKIISRKRKGGIKLEKQESDDGLEDANKSDLKVNDENKDCVPDFESELRLQEEAKKEESSKSHSDNLWSDFMKSTNTKPKPKAVNQTAASTTTLTTTKCKPVKNKMDDLFAGTSAATKHKTKTIEVEYDFAGESVKISKEVNENSHEAIKASGQKRAGGLGSLLNKLSKKPKLGTLGKSKLDWDSYKNKEGLVEEMCTHNKGKNGYIERKNFLERTDLRQFEKERDVRLSSRKPQ